MNSEELADIEAQMTPEMRLYERMSLEAAARVVDTTIAGLKAHRKTLMKEIARLRVHEDDRP